MKTRIPSSSIATVATSLAASLTILLAVFLAALLPVPAALADPSDDAYVIDENVLIPTGDGATISAFVVRRKIDTGPLPAVLSFGIYTYERFLEEAKVTADRGYAAVYAFTRGKRHSDGPVVPYEYDGADANRVIDWIIEQPWSNDEVGMIGGSYLGFVQWSTVKHGVHPALKTIVPQVAVVPGIDFPMENNVFWNMNTLPWTYYVANGPDLDDEAYGDRNHWVSLFQRWFEEGGAYGDLDKLHGQPSPIFQRWLEHPSYDAYWQAMTPQSAEFDRIDIPVLTTTGYYDGSQLGALHYFRQHAEENPDNQHVLLIGPYDHMSGQHTMGTTVSNYEVDPSARVQVREVGLAWLDHVLKGAPRPAILKDRVNMQVMGADHWRHGDTLEGLANDALRYQLSGLQSEVDPRFHELAAETATGTTTEAAPRQTVDLSDRSEHHNYYQWLVLHEELDLSNGLAFVSEPLVDTVELTGTISGELEATINKRDFDFALTFYELLPDGRYFYLTHYRGRASYAADRSDRQLLTPGEPATLPFDAGRLSSRQLSAGSRLVVLLNGNKNPYEQINYGTGGPVSNETIADAGEPLEITWGAASWVQFPIWRPLVGGTEAERETVAAISLESGG